MIRINKYLSICGVTSRRGAEGLITARRVTVNDTTVEKVGTVIDEKKDVVKVDGVEARPVEQLVYVILNKPARVMTTLHDPFKRKTIVHFLSDVPTRVYPVGRLDFDTEGVLLLTNDGDLAYRLAHPKYQVEKIYEVRVVGRFTPEAAAAIEKGIKLQDGAIGRARVHILGYGGTATRVRMTLTEGRKREIRQFCKAVGYDVRHLRRTEFATLTAHGLKLGKWRYLTYLEVETVKGLVGLQ